MDGNHWQMPYTRLFGTYYYEFGIIIVIIIIIIIIIVLYYQENNIFSLLRVIHIKTDVDYILLDRGLDFTTFCSKVYSEFKVNVK